MPEYGFAVGRFVQQVSGLEPDPPPAAQGTVRVEPVQVLPLPSYPATGMRTPRRLRLDDQGHLGEEHDGTFTRGVWLTVGRHLIKTSFYGDTPAWEFEIEVTADHTEDSPLDLTLAAPVDLPPQAVEVVRVEDRERAESAANRAELIANGLDDAIQEAVNSGDWTGPQGDRGPSGPEGPKGDQGEPGPTGDTGPEGPEGPPGEDGTRGPAGETGPQGEPGIEGATGPQGVTGERGSTGPKGEDGEPGPPGDRGPAGDAGPQGETGPEGPQGEKGETGDQGPQGQTGPMPTDLANDTADGLMPSSAYAKLQSGVAERQGQDRVVSIPSDYPTLQAAVDELASVQVDHGGRIILRIESGHELTHGLRIVGGDHSKFWIQSEDQSVPVAEEFSPVDSSSVSESNTAIFYFENCRAPVLDCLIEAGGGRPFDGLIAHLGTHVDAKVGAGVQGTRMNLEVRDGTISAKSTKWSHASRGCMRLTDNTRFSVSGSEAHDSWLQPPDGHSPVSAALHISRGSMGQAQTMKIDRSGFRAISVRRSFVHFDGTTINSTGVNGGSTHGAINIMAGSTIVLGNVQFNGSTISPSHCGVTAFNVPTAHGTVYGTGKDLITTGDTQSVTATNIASRLSVQQRLLPAFSLNNPDVQVSLGEPLDISAAFVSVAKGTQWMGGSGFSARQRAVNTLICGIGATGNGVRIRMVDQSLAVDDTVDLVVTIIGKPV